MANLEVDQEGVGSRGSLEFDTWWIEPVYHNEVRYLLRRHLEKGIARLAKRAGFWWPDWQNQQCLWRIKEKRNARTSGSRNH